MKKFKTECLSKDYYINLMTVNLQTETQNVY